VCQCSQVESLFFMKTFHHSTS